MRRNHLLWLGPLVGLAGAISYFLVFARFPALRDVPWLNLALVLGGLALSVGALWRAFRRPRVFRGRVLGTLGVVLSAGVALLFQLYIFVFSYGLPAPTATARTLAAVPELTLADAAGQPVRFGDFRGRKLVVVFYRGFW